MVVVAVFGGGRDRCGKFEGGGRRREGCTLHRLVRWGTRDWSASRDVSPSTRVLTRSQVGPRRKSTAAWLGELQQA